MLLGVAQCVGFYEPSNCISRWNYGSLRYCGVTSLLQLNRGGHLTVESCPANVSSIEDDTPQYLREPELFNEAAHVQVLAELNLMIRFQ
jgi:hypothetical protein